MALTMTAIIPPRWPNDVIPCPGFPSGYIIRIINTMYPVRYLGEVRGVKRNILALTTNGCSNETDLGASRPPSALESNFLSSCSVQRLLFHISGGGPRLLAFWAAVGSVPTCQEALSIHISSVWGPYREFFSAEFVAFHEGNLSRMQGGQPLGSGNSVLPHTTLRSS